MATTLLKNARVLLLGGGGMVGSTIAKHLYRLPRQVRPGQIILAALTQQEAERASEEVLQGCTQYLSSSSTCNINIIPVWGDMFVRQELAFETDILVGQHGGTKKDLARLRHRMMLEDLYGDFDAAYERSRLVETFREYRPQIVVDCINTATVIAYKNIFEATFKLQESLGGLQNIITNTTNSHTDEGANIHTSMCNAVDSVLDDSEIAMLAQPTPSLIRHIKILAKVSEEVGLRQYIKIGTTGTGGMGMNIPYTHSENKTCPTLLAKTFAAFGHSGLLMLWSCTPGAPVVKEIKPAAAIGYRGIGVREVKDRFGNSKIRQFRAIKLGETDTLDLREEKPKTNYNGKHSSMVSNIDTSYPEICPLIMKVLDLGENGFFTRDEFMTITAQDQMEMITPQEISEQVVQELLGVSTGKNVLSAMKGSLLGPGYRAGIERMKADLRLRNYGSDVDIGATAPSIALGKLGPPQLSKLLFEANILKDMYGTYRNLIDANAEEAAQVFVAMAEKLQQQQQQPGETTTNMSSIQSSLHVAPSVGVPILLQGNILLRGANISVPDVTGHSSIIPCPKGDVLDKIAGCGWIDLRHANIELWQERAHRILQSHSNSFGGTVYDDKEGSSGTMINIEDEAIVAFDMAAWVLGRELEGHRDFYLA